MGKDKITQKDIVEKAEETTVKKLFTSSEFYAGLEAILLSSIDRRYASNYSLDLEWNKKNGDVAYTNGTRVYINLNNSISDSFKNLPYRALSYKGLLAHELGHILFSDFQLLREYGDSFLKGDIPNENSISHPNKEELKELLSESPFEREIISHFALNVNNLLEDIYIEAKVIEEFPGALKTGIAINNERIGATRQSIDKQLKTLHKVFVIVNGLISSLKAQISSYGKDEEVKNYLAKLVPICRKMSYSSNAKTRENGATYVVLELLPLLKDFIDKAKQNYQQQQQEQGQQNNSQNSSGDSSSQSISCNLNGNSNSQSQQSQPQNQQSQNSGNQSQPNSSQNGENNKQNGNTQSTDNGKNDKSGNDSSNGKEEENKSSNSNSNNSNSSSNTKLSQEEEKELEEQIKKAIEESLAQKTVQPQGYNKPQNVGSAKNDADPNAMKNTMDKIVLDDSVSEAKKVAGKGKVTFDKKYVGSEYDREEEKLKKILYDKARNELVNSKEKEFTNSLKKLARDTHLKGIHQGVDIVVHRQANANRLPSKEDYNEYLRMYDIPKIVKSARKDLDKVLKAEAFEDELQKQYAGNKFSVRNAYRPDKRVFAKTHQPMEQKELSVSIMVDNSGSMYGERINSAKRTAVMLYEFCKAENIPITIMGHTEGWKGVELYSFADADSFDNKDGQRLLTMQSLSCNRDGAAIRFACERLIKRPEEKKLFIIISDGQPAATGYYGEAAYKDLNSIKREYERKGIEFIAAAIGDDKDRIKMIYGRNYLDVDNLEKLPKQLSKIISRKVLE